MLRLAKHYRSFTSTGRVNMRTPSVFVLALGLILAVTGVVDAGSISPGDLIRGLP
jgi:hypothetical protein